MRTLQEREVRQFIREYESPCCAGGMVVDRFPALPEGIVVCAPCRKQYRVYSDYTMEELSERV